MKNKLVIGFISIALVLALSFAVLTPAAQAKPKANVCKASHTIKSSDTLGWIADKYDVRVVDIVAVNNIHSPYTIYVGASLCIPKDSKPESSHPNYADNPAANFNPAISGDKLTIRTTSFPKASSYYVKVAPPGTRSSSYAKIGMFKTGSGGTVQSSYILPKELRKYKTLSVCLKNVSTDDNICRKVNLP